jgi:hypothetical protein
MVPANSRVPSDRLRCRFPDSAIAQRAKIEQPSKLTKASVHKHFRRYDPSKSPTRFPEDPIFNSRPWRVRQFRCWPNSDGYCAAQLWRDLCSLIARLPSRYSCRGAAEALYVRHVLMYVAVALWLSVRSPMHHAYSYNSLDRGCRSGRRSARTGFFRRQGK